MEIDYSIHVVKTVFINVLTSENLKKFYAKVIYFNKTKTKLYQTEIILKYYIFTKSQAVILHSISNDWCLLL